MVQIDPSTPMVLVDGDRRLVLRLLAARQLDLAGAWELPVMADVAGLEGALQGTVEITTASGVIRSPARLDPESRGLMLRRAPGGPVECTQRRGAVRGRVVAPVAGTLITGRAAGAFFAGQTRDLSGSGIAVTLSGPSGLTVPDGVTAEVRITLAGPPPVYALVEVLGATAGVLRGRFTEITSIDRERLISLVFAAQREDLRARAARAGR
jgi:hypothetical protein